ncbi:MAG: hypothetical protein BMS9Abin26_1250 [Gammaproteobacteria bacterium]|nr:MAG: hypothetical protein BMS9Abin26_1250 [Gammaproteobacteria bacterium]
MENTLNIQLAKIVPGKPTGPPGASSGQAVSGPETRDDPGSFSRVLEKQTVRQESGGGKDGRQETESAATKAISQNQPANERQSVSEDSDSATQSPASNASEAEEPDLHTAPPSSEESQAIDPYAGLPQGLSPQLQQLPGLLKPAELAVPGPGVLLDELESLATQLLVSGSAGDKLDSVNKINRQQLVAQLLQDSTRHDETGLINSLPDTASIVTNQVALLAVPQGANNIPELELSAGPNLALNIRAVIPKASERTLQTAIPFAGKLINADDDTIPTTLREAAQALKFTEMAQEQPVQGRAVLSNLITDTLNTPRSGGNSEINSLFSPLGASGINGDSYNINGSPRMVLNVPVNQPGWDQALGSRILWMVNRDVQVAEIKLNPPQLGPLEVRIAVANDQTNVTFVSNNSVTRELLDGAIPRLREMFDEQGVNLVNVDVSEHSLARQEQHETNDSRGGSGQWSNDNESDDVSSGPLGMAQHASMSAGMLDTYA